MAESGPPITMETDEDASVTQGQSASGTGSPHKKRNNENGKFIILS